MSSSELSGTTAVVTGATRGFGRSITVALHGAGAEVVAVARNAEQLGRLRSELGPSLTVVAADAADPVVAGSLVDQYRPTTLVLNAGAPPLMRPIQHQTWEAFSRNWEVDVAQAFHWTREALLAPLPPGSTVIALSSGAALFGSPLSGGYAGAKATVRFITGYAAEESARAGLGIRFVSVLPKLTPATDLGAMAVAAYARRDGVDVDEAAARLGPALTPDHVGKLIADLASSTDRPSGAYLLTPDGLKDLTQ
ncbi:MAG TPA: SDR family oxidoreductase [Acidimicrobiia bacterium]|jgi:NAD(P)-dependent dehydrogenase (short-subunit alcohol dehydrogenase family)